MKYPTFIALCTVRTALGASVFLNEADTGISETFGNLSRYVLPQLDMLHCLEDFDWAARNYMPDRNYSQLRYGSGGEWSYRNNLEVFEKVRMRPRVMLDITKVEASMPTTILGYNFSSPLYIAPAARAGEFHSEAEGALADAARQENILYIVAGTTSLRKDQIYNRNNSNQIIFQQMDTRENLTAMAKDFQDAESNGAKAIVFSVDSVADRNRVRTLRHLVPGQRRQSDIRYEKLTWDMYNKYTKLTKLPLILKGVASWEDAVAAVKHGVPAIILSNHGGRQVDYAPSPLDVAIEIHVNAPQVFKQIEVYADGGVRWGTDVLKLLALGVRAVGMGRPFMYALPYGTQGTLRVAQLIKAEVANNAANLGFPDIQKLNASHIAWSKQDFHMD